MGIVTRGSDFSIDDAQRTGRCQSCGTGRQGACTHCDVEFVYLVVECSLPKERLDSEETEFGSMRIADYHYAPEAADRSARSHALFHPGKIFGLFTGYRYVEREGEPVKEGGDGYR